MDVAAATALLRERLDVTLVYLFGSHARGDAHAGSDVDLAVLTAEPIALSPLELLALRADLEARLGAPVDLIDLMQASDVLRVQVIAHGKLLHERSRSERDAFEMFALSRYAHLNEERAGILADVFARGSVRG